LSFPQEHRLIHRTRLAFIDLDNVLSYAKRDRDGRVDGYLTTYLPEECLLVFLREGEAVNAASLHPSGREVITIADALARMRAEVERGELAYSTAPTEQLAWMYQSCAVPLEVRALDSPDPGTLFRALKKEKVTGVLELISEGRVSYMRFDDGRLAGGHFCGKPESMPVAAFVESQFQGTDGRALPLSVALFPAVGELPAQAPKSLINSYREVYWRIVDEVDKEFPGQARRRASKICAGILEVLSVPRGAEPPEVVVGPDELAGALADWSLQLLEGFEVMMPGTAIKILEEATREHRYVLQSAGFYTRLPWQVAW
jgi:hypothetical protein